MTISKFERDTNRLTISAFYELFELNKYDFSPAYQRSSEVWGGEQQSFLIDSIMKNFPIPAIFLNTRINPETGKSTYEIIDGKQRLTSIVKFIENEISLPDDFGEDNWGDGILNGLFFKEISADSLYRKNFWSYSIPVEYIETTDEQVIKNIFDRLNRNGERLNNQELRNAKYMSSYLLEQIKGLSNEQYWKDKLIDLVGENRMENIDFISELFFALGESSVFSSSPKVMDELYGKWIDKNDVEIDEVANQFREVTAFLDQLNIDLKDYKINGVSHLYGLWLLAIECVEKKISPDEIRNKLIQMYTMLKEKNYTDESVKDYKQSMSHGTKNQSQRTKRLDSLKKFVLE